jgi:hypothetical protein
MQWVVTGKKGIGGKGIIQADSAAEAAEHFVALFIRDAGSYLVSVKLTGTEITQLFRVSPGHSTKEITS